MVRLSGSCHLTFAFEVGQNIDLEASERCLGPTERQTVRSRQRVPRYFEYRPALLVILLVGLEIVFGFFGVTRR